MWFSAVVKMDRIRPYIFERKTATKWYKTNIAIFGDTYKPGTFHDPASEDYACSARRRRRRRRHAAAQLLLLSHPHTATA